MNLRTIHNWRVVDALTERQRQVLTLLGQAMSRGEVAFALKLSVKTVEHHIAVLYRKFKNNNCELLRLIGYEFLVRDSKV